MRSEGDLITDNEILIIFEAVPQPPWEHADETIIDVVLEPLNAQYTFTKFDNQGDVWVFKTQTAGNYQFEGAVTFINDYNGHIPEFSFEEENLSVAITAPPVTAITQTHEIVSDGSAGDCNNVGVKITGSQPFNKVNGVTIASTTEYILLKGRQDAVTITIEATDPQYGTNSKTSQETVNFMGQVAATGTYLDVTVTEGVFPNVYTYDFGSGFQSLNKFTFASEGTHIIRVRDGYGCIKQLSYEASNLPIVEPTDVETEIYLSKGNSLLYVEQVVHDSCGNFPKDEDTYDKDEPYKEMNYEYNQRVKKCNDITTQIKSNYDTHVATWYNTTTGASGVMDVDMVKQFLFQQDQRQYFRTDDDLYTYIYFDDGLLPWFYTIGQNCVINGETRQILGLADLEDQNAIALKVQKISGVTNAGTINYTYNAHSTNVFEFVFPAKTMPDGCFYIELIATKDADSKTFKTPIFKVDSDFEETVDIMYYSSINTDIYYADGFKNNIVIGCESRVPLVDAELTVIKSDSTNFLKSSFNAEKFEYVFEPLTLEMMRKVVIAMCHDNLIINGVGYAVQTVDIETPDPTTNLHVITAAMYKSEKNINFVSSTPVDFTWASGQVKFDSSITIDRTTL